MSKLATVLTFTSRVFVSVRHPVSARHLSFTFQRVPPQTPVTLRSADCGSWRPNRDPRISDPCLYFYYLVFVLYCLFLVWLSSQERNGLTTGSCSPAYGGEMPNHQFGSLTGSSDLSLSGRDRRPRLALRKKRRREMRKITKKVRRMTLDPIKEKTA